MAVVIRRLNPTVIGEDGKPLTVVNLKRRFDGLTGKTGVASSNVIPKVNKMLAKGLINPEATGAMGDPETLDQFIRLYNIGASFEIIAKVLNIDKRKYNHLLGQYQDMCIEGIVGLGPLGVLGTAYTRLHDLSQKAMSMLGTLSGKADQKDHMELMRFVKDIEAEKVRMMVTTGAVAQRKKVEVHQHFTSSATDAKVVSPAKIMGLLTALLDEGNVTDVESTLLADVGIGDE